MTGETGQRADQEARVPADTLLLQVRQLAVELHPRRGRSLLVTL